MRIARIDAYPCRYPTYGSFKFFNSHNGREGRPAVIIRITADDGTLGWGQSVPIETWSYETLETATVVIREYYAPALVGLDPTDIAKLNERMSAAISPSFSTGMPIARAGIDIALHDLTGKLRGRSIRELWGTTGVSSITLSWTISAATLPQAQEQLDAGRQRGYRNFNIKVGGSTVAFDTALAGLVRETNPEGFLWADANGGYDLETALNAAPALADAGVDVLEAPLRPNRISGYRELKRQGALPIFMDEGVVSPVELEEFIKLGMLDGLAIKPARCGGLLPARLQIETIERYGLRWLGSGLADPDISLAASLALYGAYGLKAPAALNGPQFFEHSVLVDPIRIEGDRAFVPEGAGLGIEVDEDKMALLVHK